MSYAACLFLSQKNINLLFAVLITLFGIKNACKTFKLAQKAAALSLQTHKLNGEAAIYTYEHKYKRTLRDRESFTARTSAALEKLPTLTSTEAENLKLRQPQPSVELRRVSRIHFYLWFFLVFARFNLAIKLQQRWSYFTGFQQLTGTLNYGC